MKIGVTGLVPRRSEIKRAALFFEKIAVPDLEIYNEAIKDKEYLDELDFLQREDLIFDAGSVKELGEASFDEYKSATSSVDLKEQIRFLNMSFGNTVVNFGEYNQILARIMSGKLRVLNQILAIPVLPLSMSKSTESKATLTDVAEILLPKIPIPDELTPWEAILEFRNDPDVKANLAGLKSWISDIVKQDLTEQEINDKIEWLLFKQKQHIRYHKIKYKMGIIGTTVKVSAEIIDNIMRLRFGKLVDEVIKLTNKRCELIKAELEGPAPELNYILRVQDSFT